MYGPGQLCVCARASVCGPGPLCPTDSDVSAERNSALIEFLFYYYGGAYSAQFLFIFELYTK